MLVHRSALVERSAEHMFDLIEAAEHYPSFLPWCAAATIVSRDAGVVSADIEMKYAGMHFALRTRNPKQRPTSMVIHLEQGPFERFEGEWRLHALTPRACKVDFVLDYAFDSAWMSRVAGPVFDRIANSMVDAFVRRAEELPEAVPPAAG